MILIIILKIINTLLEDLIITISVDFYITKRYYNKVYG